MVELAEKCSYETNVILSSLEPTEAFISHIPKETIEPILAGELRLPAPEEESCFRSIQDQVDQTIVRRLPPEFWGSRFYMDSSTVLKPVSTHRLPPSRSAVLDTLCEIANHKEPQIMQNVHTRFSRKRSKRYLKDLCRSYATVVDEG